MSTGIPVVMLAGGDKANLDVGGKPMMRWVVEAFRTAGHPITTMALDDRIIGAGIDVLIPEDTGLVGKLFEVLELHREERRVVVTTCDIPCVTPKEITSFLGVASCLKADVVIPVVQCGVHPEFERFPATKIWVDGKRLTMGSIFVINPASLLRNRGAVEDLIRHRKDVLGLAEVAGPGFVLKFLAAQLMRGRGLSPTNLEAVLSKLVGGISVRAVVAGPGIGFDGDNPNRCELLARILEERSAANA